MSGWSLNSSKVGAPWQNYEELKSVVDGLFSDARGRITAALSQLTEWQKEENLPDEIEISAVLISVSKEIPSSFTGVQEISNLSQHAKKSMITLGIQRLVSSVVDPKRKSIKKCASAAGLPPLLVRIRNESAHGTIHELPILLSASEEALVWLKVKHWEKRLEPLARLAQVRSELKIFLDLHCMVVSQLFDPLILHQLNRHTKFSGQKERVRFCFEKLLNLSLSSPQELVFIIVDAGTLTSVDTSSLHDTLLPQVSGSVERLTDLTSAMDIARRYTVRQLSFHLPELPAMLLMAFMTDINSKRFAEFESDTIKCLIRLTSWYHWLLGEEFPQAVKHSDGVLRQLNLAKDELQQLKILELTLAKFVRLELRKKFVDELLHLYDQTLVWGFPFSTLEPYLSFNLEESLDDVYADSKRQTIGLSLRSFGRKGAAIDDRFTYPDGVTPIVGQVLDEEFRDAGDMLRRPAKRRHLEGLNVPVAQRATSANNRRQPNAPIDCVKTPPNSEEIPQNGTAREFGGMAEQLSPQDRKVYEELSPKSRESYMMKRVVERLELEVLRQYKRNCTPVVPISDPS